MSMVLPAWIGGAMALTVVAALASAKRSAPITPDGWKRLRPGGMMNLALVFGAAISWLPIELWLSDASPWNRQPKMICLYLALLFVFGGMTLCVGWLYYIRRIEWNGDRFRVWVPIRGETYYYFGDVTALTPGIDGSECKLKMSAGAVVRVSLLLRGSGGFMLALDRHSTGLAEG